MAVVISCPQCQQVKEYKKGEIRSCSVCGAEFPHDMRETVARAISRKRPVLLTVFAAFFSFFAGVGFLIEFTALIGSGPYTINGEPATKLEFLKGTLGLVSFIVPAAVVAFGIWSERSWARPLFFALYLLAGIFAIVAPNQFSGDFSADDTTVDVASLAVAQQTVGGVISFLLIIGLLGWYLYFKSNVVAYYRELKAEGR